MKVPKDPWMLQSILNMKLRDFYSSLDAMKEDLLMDWDTIEQMLKDANIVYDEKENRFVTK